MVGLLTVVLLIDDRFLLHDLVLPHFGVPEILARATVLVDRLRASGGARGAASSG